MGCQSDARKLSFGSARQPLKAQAALNYSADHAAAKHSRDAEAEQKYQARAALLPQISANAVYQKRNCRYCCIDSYCFSFSIKLPHKNIPSGRGMHI